MEDSVNLIKKWQKWYPKKIFFKNNENNQKFLHFSDNFKEEDFYTDSKNSVQSDCHIKSNSVLKTDVTITEGYKIGFKKGILEAKSENDFLNKKINKLFLDFESSFLNFEKELYSQVLKISLIVSSYIIGKETDLNKTILLKHIKKVINKDSIFNEKIQLVVHPDNKTFIEEILKNLSSYKKWKILYDSNIDLNGCKVKLDDIYLDSTVNARWQELNRLIYSEE